MGWKSVKDHYRIEHTVHVRQGKILIASPYISDLIVIEKDGTISKSPDGPLQILNRYQDEMRSDPDTLRRLIEAEDIFERSVPIFTYDGGTILEKFCEDPETSDSTHDGMRIRGNRFSTNPVEVVKMAVKDALYGVKCYEKSISELEDKLRTQRELLQMEKDNLAKLHRDFPDLLGNDKVQ